MKKFVICLVLTIFAFVIPCRTTAQMRPGDVDIYAGIDFNYRDIMLRGHFTDLLICITPSVKWNPGHNWEIGASAWIPVLNQFGNYYKYVRINTAVVSWQFGTAGHWRTKFTGGVFTGERYGLDIKTMYDFNSWFALRAELGLTGKLTMSRRWEMSPMTRFTFEAGPDFWLNKWRTMLSLRGGRYIYGDFGIVAEAIRNFKHTSVSVFGQYSSQGKAAAGFKVIIMIPPYKRWCGKVHVRPASNFRLTYLTNGASRSCVTYRTDDEQNERTGWFNRDLLPWGPQTMPADFKPCPVHAGDASAGSDATSVHVVEVSESAYASPDSISQSETILQSIQRK